jgi:hypothetical protein
MKLKEEAMSTVEISTPHQNLSQNSALAPAAGMTSPEQDSDGFPYETADFHQCWWEFLAPKFDIPFKDSDLLVHRKKVMKGLVSLRELRISGWNNAWTQDLTIERAQRFTEMHEKAGWDYFRMTWPESRQSLQAFEQLEKMGYTVIHQPAPQQYVIDLSQGMEGYLQSLSHNGRKGLKKKVRKGQPLSPTLVPCTQETEIEAFFEELFRHHQAYWDEKAGGSYFNDREERDFIVNWAKVLHRQDRLVLDKLTMNGDTVNLSMGIVFGKTFYWLLTINTSLYADYGPGMIGLYMRLEQCAAQGIQCFNLGPGDYFYKVQSANSREICRETIVCNPKSLKGKLYEQWLQNKRCNHNAINE